MTSLLGPGERNFNAVSHKPTRAPIQSVPVAPVSFGLWDTALKIISPGPRNDVTDHLEESLDTALCKFPGLPFGVPNLSNKIDFSVSLCFSLDYNRFFGKFRNAGFQKDSAQPIQDGLRGNDHPLLLLSKPA